MLRVTHHFLTKQQTITQSLALEARGGVSYREVSEIAFDLLLSSSQEVVDEGLHDARKDLQLLRRRRDARDLPLISRV